jgi:hypothetical protein
MQIVSGVGSHRFRLCRSDFRVASRDAVAALGSMSEVLLALWFSLDLTMRRL